MTNLTRSKRRRRTAQPAENHEQSPLNRILSDPMGFIAELRALVDQANQERATILVRAFAEEYPDYYQFAESLVYVSPEMARDEVVKRWPKAGLMKIYPDHLAWIELIQNQIKMRREGNHGRREIVRT